MKTRLLYRISYFMVLALFLVVLTVGVLMAHNTPYSGRAYVEIGAVPVYAKVGGIIDEIYVHTNEPVQRFAPLFKLDDRNFIAEVDRLEALLANTEKQLKSLDAQIRSAEQEEVKLQNIFAQAQTDFERDTRLYQSRVISEKKLEDCRLSLSNAQQDLLAAQSQTATLRSQRGNPEEESSEEKQLKAELMIARNNLNDTVIRAPEDGLLDYHQLYRGQVIDPKEHYAIIHDLKQMVIHVDLLEKSAGNLKTDQEVLVAFDILPNQLFHAKVTGFGRMVQPKYTAPNQLNVIDEDTRWIRTAGRIRVQLQLTESLPNDVILATGSKAATAFLNPGSPNLSGLNRMWIKLVAFCNYIY